MVHNMPQAAAAALAQKYGQIAHLQSDKGIHNEFSHRPDYTPMPGHHGHILNEYLDDNYSEVPFEEGGKTRFRLNLEPPKTVEPSGPFAHQHSYDWQNGHTQHYGAKPSEVTEKMEKFESELKPADTFNQVASWFGVVNPIRQSNLNFYHLAPYENAIDDLIKQHGYKVHLYDQPEEADLANKNYDTKHLAIQNPKPIGKEDRGEIADARAYRKLHELAHAMTLAEINKKYGEGKRVGQLGIEITPWEAKRALEWEHKAARQQRILAGQVGHSMTNEQANQEQNTTMADAMHRVLYGHHVDPSSAGFIPKSTKVSLPSALKSIDQIAQLAGVDDEGYLPREEVFGKGEGLRKILLPNSCLSFPQLLDNQAHGLITPNGEYQYIPAQAEHHIELQKHSGMAAQDAMKAGWLTIGHGGESNIQGHSKILGNPTHPATQTARRLASQHFGRRMIIFYTDESGYMPFPRPGVSDYQGRYAGPKVIMTHNWSKHGTHVGPDSIAAMRASETEPPDSQPTSKPSKE